MTDAHVVFVEDEMMTRRVVEVALQHDNIRVSSVGTLGQCRATLLREFADLLLLDLMLPDGDGVPFCRELRERSTIPIIMLTSRNDTESIVAGLEAGADDYIVKPVAPSVLVARVRAHLRRVELDREPPPERIQIQNVVIMPEERRVQIGDAAVSFGPKEFDLLLFLARRAGRVVTRDALLEEMWADEERSEKILNVYIRRIREKIERDPTNPLLIETIRGSGYRFAK